MADLPDGKPILCVDFDGVIHSYSSGWKGPRCIPDPPVSGAMEFLTEATKHFDVQIYSSRSRYWFARKAMRAWLFRYLAEHYNEIIDEASIIHDSGFTSRTTVVMSQIKFPTKKPPAFLTIDDRAICFTGKFPDAKWLLEFKPWNKD